MNHTLDYVPITLHFPRQWPPRLRPIFIELTDDIRGLNDFISLAILFRAWKIYHIKPAIFQLSPYIKKEWSDEFRKKNVAIYKSKYYSPNEPMTAFLLISSLTLGLGMFMFNKKISLVISYWMLFNFNLFSQLPSERCNSVKRLLKSITARIAFSSVIFSKWPNLDSIKWNL